MSDFHLGQSPASAKKNSSPSRPPAEVHAGYSGGEIARLQETIGNQAVLRLMRAKSAGSVFSSGLGQSPASVKKNSSPVRPPAEVHAGYSGGEIARLQETIGNQAVLRLMRAKPTGSMFSPMLRASDTPSSASSPVQRPDQLTINTPGDCYEQEADRVAEQVMHMPGAEPAPASMTGASFAVRRKCDCGGTCVDCRKHRPDDQFLTMQRKTASPGVSGATEAPPVVHNVLRSPGRPLDTVTRAFMEPRFRHDFSNVRVHADSQAIASAEAVQARAYTVGSDIVFGSGQYVPGTRSGQQLLAHELAHVVQQEGGIGSPASSAGASQLFRQPEFTMPGITLTPPEPRSLYGSVDAAGLNNDALALEIRLIQEWLEAHPERQQDSDFLRAERDRLQAILLPRQAPFEVRFYIAWGQAAEAARHKVFEADKAYHDSSIWRGMMNVEDLVPEPAKVWQYGMAANLFSYDEEKLVNEWSEELVKQTFEKRFIAAKYGHIFGDDYQEYRTAPENIWRRGTEYGLFLPSEKATVLQISDFGVARANVLNQWLSRVDPNSPEAARLMDEIHDFTEDPAVVLLGPQLEKLFGPYGYTYYDSASASSMRYDINRAYSKSLGPHQIRKSASSLRERWDECQRRRHADENNLEAAEYDPDCFQSEHEFYEEWLRRNEEFRKQYKACGHSGPDDIKCQDKVAAEYFPRKQAQQAAIYAWAYAEMETYQGVVEGGLLSQTGFHFAHDVLEWSTERSASFGGFVSTVGNLGAVYTARQANLRTPPANTPQPKTPITEMVDRPEPMPQPDLPQTDTSPRVAEPGPPDVDLPPGVAGGKSQTFWTSTKTTANPAVGKIEQGVKPITDISAAPKQPPPTSQPKPPVTQANPNVPPKPTSTKQPAPPAATKTAAAPWTADELARMKEQRITSLTDVKAAKEAEQLRIALEQQQALEVERQEAEQKAAQMTGGRTTGSGRVSTGAPPTTTSRTSSTRSSSGGGGTGVSKRVGPSTGQRTPYDLEATGGGEVDKDEDLYESRKALEGRDPGQEGKQIRDELGTEAVRPAAPHTPGEYDPTVGDSRLLGKRMKAAGEPRPGKGYQAHHMIPSSEPSADQVRQFILYHGFKDINDVDNGVWLPTGKRTANIGAEFKHEFTFDKKSFAGEYFHRLEDIFMIEGITENGIRLRLRRLKSFLENGQLPPAEAFSDLPL